MKYTAFQTVDPDGDIWSNTALLFKTPEKAREFFNNPQLVIDTLEFEVEDDEDIDNCIQLLELDNGSLYGVIINLIYCGECKILQMSTGFVIE